MLCRSCESVAISQGLYAQRREGTAGRILCAPHTTGRERHSAMEWRFLVARFALKIASSHTRYRDVEHESSSLAKDRPKRNTTAPDLVSKPNTQVQ